MLLLVDAGNTRIKWALLERSMYTAVTTSRAEVLGRWTASGVVAHADLGALVNAWRGMEIARILLSNVAGQAMRSDLEQILLRALGPKPVPVECFRSTPEAGGLRNAYRQPAQLGCDRFASAIGAHALYPNQPLIVATCGTATTIDAISADGSFIGGMILPGAGLMANALARNTAQLPQVAHQVDLTAPFADNTDDAIVSGIIAAQTGAIERAVAAHAQGHGAVRCIISGGAAVIIAPHLSIECDTVDNLVLIGLQTVVMQQTSPC